MSFGGLEVIIESGDMIPIVEQYLISAKYKDL